MMPAKPIFQKSAGGRFHFCLPVLIAAAFGHASTKYSCLFVVYLNHEKNIDSQNMFCYKKSHSAIRNIFLPSFVTKYGPID